MSDAPSQLTEAVVGPKRNLDGLYNLAKELFADMADRVQVSPPVNACDSNSDAFFTIYSLTKKKKERCEEIARVGACGDSSYELHIGGLVCGRRLNDDIARNIVGPRQGLHQAFGTEAETVTRLRKINLVLRSFADSSYSYNISANERLMKGLRKISYDAESVRPELQQAFDEGTKVSSHPPGICDLWRLAKKEFSGTNYTVENFDSYEGHTYFSIKKKDGATVANIHSHAGEDTILMVTKTGTARVIETGPRYEGTPIEIARALGCIKSGRPIDLKPSP